MSPRLAAVPDAAPRALGLIRVSRERDGMISPEVQRTSITDYAVSRGYEVTGWLEGLDESGSRSRSAWWPRLDQAVAAVEAGEYDVLLVWKFSRTARNRLRWAVAIDRVESGGGRLESATEQFDTTTSSGRLARGMLAELNAFEAERTGETWKEAHDQRVARGLPATGKPRYGYRYDRDRKLHVPDAETGPVLVDLYRRYVAGEGFNALVDWLNVRALWTTAGGPWAPRTLRRVMDTGFATGRFTHRGELHDGVHERLIDEELWLAYQARRSRQRNTSPRVKASPYLLSGLVRCAKCGAAMNGAKPSATSRDTYRYRCRNRVEFGSVRCDALTAQMGLTDEAVLEWVTALAEDIDGAEAAAADQAGPDAAERVEAELLARDVARIEAAMERFALQHAQTPLPQSVYERGWADLDGQLRVAAARLQAVRESSTQATRAQAHGVARGIIEEWDERPLAVRREALLGLIGAVLVTGGRPVTVRVVPRWELHP